VANLKRDIQLPQFASKTDGNTIDEDYFYDGNGNMVEDKNKNIIAIEYNHLNLPTHIQFDNSSPVPDGTINYVYDATGIKMEKKVSMEGSGSTNTQYAGNYVYENRINIIPGGTTTSSELKFFSHPEGYAEPDGLGNFDYIYQYKDHLGNIRLSYKLEGLEEEIDNFNDGTTGSWGSHNSTITNDNEQLKVVLSNAETGIYKTVSVTAGEALTIELNLDNGTTNKVSLYEYNIGKISDLVDGHNQISYTPTISGDFFLLIVKDPTSMDVGTQTNFYLDNIGITIGEDELVIVEENNYYPFGLKHKGYNNVVNGTDHKYGFGGKEYDESLGINGYDFGSRNYDPALGRWFNIDPFAELMRNQSPYNFGFNNPIYFSDYAGTIPWPLPEFWKIWRRKSAPDEYFGYIKRRKRNHNGLDLNYSGGGNTDYGAPVVATHSGKVARIIPLSANDGGGRVIVIESPDGSFQTKYMHLSSVAVQAGQEISEGQTIGLMGGSAFGKEKGRTAHLHYEIHKRSSNGTYSAINPWSGDQPIDPQKWINPMPSLHSGTEAEWSSFWTGFMDTIKEGKMITGDKPTVTESRGTVAPASTLTPVPIVPLPGALPSGGTITPINPGGGGGTNAPPIICTDCNKPKG